MLCLQYIWFSAKCYTNVELKYSESFNKIAMIGNLDSEGQKLKLCVVTVERYTMDLTPKILKDLFRLKSELSAEKCVMQVA